MPLVMDQAMLFPRVKGAGGGRVLAPTSGAFGSALRDIFPYGEVGSEQALGVTQPSFCAFREGAIAYIGATDTLLIQALCQYGGTVPSPDNSAGFIRQAKATNVLAANGDPKLLNFTYSTAYATSSRGAGGWGANSNFLVDLKNGTVLRGHVESAYTSNTSAGWSDYPPGGSPATRIGVKLYLQKSTNNGDTWTKIDGTAGATDITTQCVVPCTGYAMSFTSIGSDGGGTPKYRFPVASTGNMPTTYPTATWYAKINGNFTSDLDGLNNNYFYFQRADATHADLVAKADGSAPPTYVAGHETITGSATITPALGWFSMCSATLNAAGLPVIACYGRLGTDVESPVTVAFTLRATTLACTTWVPSTQNELLAVQQEKEPGIALLGDGRMYMDLRTAGIANRYGKVSSDNGASWGGQFISLAGTGNWNTEKSDIVAVGGQAVVLANTPDSARDADHGVHYWCSDPTGGSANWQKPPLTFCFGGYSNTRMAMTPDGVIWTTMERDAAPTTSYSLRVWGRIALVATNVAAIKAAAPDQVEMPMNDLPAGLPAWSGMIGVRDIGNCGAHGKPGGAPVFKNDSLSFPAASYLEMSSGSANNFGATAGLKDDTYELDYNDYDTGDGTLEIGLRCPLGAGSGVVWGGDSRVGTHVGANTGGLKVSIAAGQLQFTVDDGTTNPSPVLTSTFAAMTSGSSYHIVVQRDVTGQNGPARKLNYWIYNATTTILLDSGSITDTTTAAQNKLTNTTCSKGFCRFADTPTGAFSSTLDVLYWRFTKAALKPSAFKSLPYSKPSPETWAAIIPNTCDDPAVFGAGNLKLSMLDPLDMYVNRSHDLVASAPTNPPDGWPVEAALDRSNNSWTVTTPAGPCQAVKAGVQISGVLFIGCGLAMVFDPSTVGRFDFVSRYDQGAWSMGGFYSIPAAVQSTLGYVLENYDGSKGFQFYTGANAAAQFGFTSANGTSGITVYVNQYTADTEYFTCLRFDPPGGAGVAQGLTFYQVPMNPILLIEDFQIFPNKILGSQMAVASGNTTPGTTGSANALTVGGSSGRPASLVKKSKLFIAKGSMTEAQMLAHAQAYNKPATGGTLAPVAAISGQPVPSTPSAIGIAAGGVVNLVDASTNGPTAWHWTLYDETGTAVQVKTTQNASFTISTRGIYSVTLTVANALGQNAVTVSNFIWVGFSYLAENIANCGKLAGGSAVQNPNDPIATLVDHSGQSHDFSQGTVGNQPLYGIGGGPGGYNWIHWTKAANEKYMVSAGTYNPARPYTIFKVFRQNAWALNKFFSLSTDLSYAYVYQPGTTPNIGTYDGANGPVNAGLPANGTWALGVFEFFNTASARVIVNGVTATGANPVSGAGETTGMMLGYSGGVADFDQAFEAILPGTGTLATDQAKNNQIAARLRTMFGGIP